MRIIAPSIGYEVQTACRGCTCHSMPVVFGDDPNRCAECGCPKTAEGVQKYAADHPASVLLSPEDVQAIGEPSRGER